MDENYLDLLFGSTSVPVLFSEKEELDSLFTLNLSLQSSECKATLFRDPSASIISAPKDGSCLLVEPVSISAGTF